MGNFVSPSNERKFTAPSLEKDGPKLTSQIHYGRKSTGVCMRNSHSIIPLRPPNYQTCTLPLTLVKNSESPLAQLIFARLSSSSSNKRASVEVPRHRQSIGSWHRPHSDVLSQPFLANITPPQERNQSINSNDNDNDEGEDVEVERSETESSGSAEDACFA
ncbi:unnamed protein product [Rodentolepis nana]|uniref:Uncharacterized protein n=1 Tax=Rodentolepis nana TaxID=102285 RepID=A0A0R3TAD6_RODNA|nr:unnamed protein product [Rodentolepis nana]